MLWFGVRWEIPGQEPVVVEMNLAALILQPRKSARQVRQARTIAVARLAGNEELVGRLLGEMMRDDENVTAVVGGRRY